MARVSEFKGQLFARNLAQGVKIELEGKWNGAKTLISQLPTALELAGFDAQVHVAEKYLKKLRRNIRTNAYGFELSPDYAMYKAKKGGNPGDVLFWSGFMMNSIILTKNKNSGMVNVTFKKGLRHPAGVDGHKDEGALTLEQIALVMEKGSETRNIPPRPVWHNTFRDMGGRLGVKKIMVRRMRRTLNATLPNASVK